METQFRVLLSLYPDLLNLVEDLDLMVGGLNIERQRAINGFKMMLSSGVLTLYSGNGIRLS